MLTEFVWHPVRDVFFVRRDRKAYCTNVFFQVREMEVPILKKKLRICNKLCSPQFTDILRTIYRI